MVTQLCSNASDEGMDVVDGPGNRSGHKIVQVSVCKSREFQCVETDVVQALAVQQHACVPISTS